MQKLKPFLWFDGNAEEAVNFYTATFSGGKILHVNRYGTDNSDAPGPVITMSFEIEGVEFMALNGGPHYTFSSAISFMISCKYQPEIDRLWDALATGGEPLQCGWIKDRFGVTWQIIPTVLSELLSDPDPEKAGRVMQKMMSMVKLDIEGLQTA
jgi:predicted 3-demethylubiquinone-9 3-methyltransferase (glyoxalase superfamily)